MLWSCSLWGRRSAGCRNPPSQATKTIQRSSTMWRCCKTRNCTPVVNLEEFIRLLPGWIHCTNWNHAAFISRWCEVSAFMARELLIFNQKFTVLTINSSDITAYSVSLALLLGKICVLLRSVKTKKLYSFYFNVTWVCCWHMSIELKYKMNLVWVTNRGNVSFLPIGSSAWNMNGWVLHWMYGVSSNEKCWMWHI